MQHRLCIARSTPLVLLALLLTLGNAQLPDYCNKCILDGNPLDPVDPKRKVAIIIGHQKSGTTFLHAALVRQPDVSAAVHKELHYLDRKHGSDISAVGYISKWKAKALALAKKLPELNGLSLSAIMDDKVGV